MANELSKKLANEKYIKEDDISLLQDGTIERLATKGNIIPFAHTCSLNRQEMITGSAIKHVVIPIEGEIPLVDTTMADTVFRSLDNMTLNEDIQFLKRVDKVIDGVVTKTFYFYRTIQDDMLCGLEFDGRVSNAHFVSDMISCFDDLEEMSIVNAGEYLTRIKNIDNNGEGVKIGRNLVTVYTTNPKLTEDAIYISDKAVDNLRYQKEYDVELFLKVNNRLRNIYGDNNNYKPFPSVGDKVVDGVVASSYSVESSVLDDTLYNNTIGDGDDIVFGYGEVVDIEAYGESDVPIIDNYIKQNQQYLYNIISTYDQLTDYVKLVNIDLQSKINHIKFILNPEHNMTVGSKELKSKNVSIKIKVIDDNKESTFGHIGEKITNRYGGKGTVSYMFKHGDFKTEEGREIDIMIAATSVFNRENVSQLFEITLNSWSYNIQQHILKHHINQPRKCVDMIKEFINTINPNMQIAYSSILKTDNDIIKYFTKHRIHYRDLPYSGNMNIMTLTNARKVLKKYNVKHGVENIYLRDEVTGEFIKLSSQHEVGEVYYWILQNNPEKGTSFRAEGGATNNRGEFSKSTSKKYHRGRFADTAVKMSDLNTMIHLDIIKHKSDIAGMLDNGTDTSGIVKTYLKSIGLDLVYEESDSTNNGNRGDR